MDMFWGTALAATILLLIIALVIFSMVRDKRAGKSVICGGSCKTCGGCCHGCPRAGACHPGAAQRKPL